MRLKSFRIKDFKGIIDSGWIDIGDLTVLVGRNENGKSCYLEALYQLNPVKGPVSIPQSSHPRIYNRLPKPEISGIFESTADEIKFLELDPEFELSYTRFCLTRYADGFLHIEPVNNHHDVIKEFDYQKLRKSIVSLPTEEEILNEDLANAAKNFIRKLFRAARECRCSIVESYVKTIATVSQEVPTRPVPKGKSHGFIRTISKNSEIRSQLRLSTHIVYKLEEIARLISEIPEIIQVRNEKLIDMVPFFIKEDNFTPYRGNLQIDEVPENRSNIIETGDGRSYLRNDNDILNVLCQLTSLDINEITNASLIRGNKSRQLDNAAKILEVIVANAWIPGENLFEIKQDGLELLINTRANNYRSPFNTSSFTFNERSYGWRSFHSLLIWFLAHQPKYVSGFSNDITQVPRFIIFPTFLLDEPGLHLDPAHQKKLIKLFKDYSNDRTIIYTTHSPFMVNAGDPASIKVIEMEGNEGSIIKSEKSFFSKNYKNKMFLQAALGMGAETSYLLSEKNLVVEGPSDYILIIEFSRLMLRLEFKPLNPEVLIISGGSASEAKTIAQYIAANELDTCLLLDSDPEGKGKKDSFEANIGSVSDGWIANAILLSDAVGLTEECWDIETFFNKEFYLSYAKDLHDDLDNVTVEELEKLNELTFAKCIDKFLSGKDVPLDKVAIAKKLREWMQSKTVEDADLVTNLKFQEVKSLIGEINRIFDNP